MSKAVIPKGTRDFGTIEMQRRNYIFDTLKPVFKMYGFQSIETPAMENSSTLLGKYGKEGDRLIFKILPRGEKLEKITNHEKLDSKTISTASTEALRYDLTVPFARYVVQHQNDITFPFKRFQIQPVWRADRPQKGRYREFYQCDVDVIGSTSLLNEIELIQIVHRVFLKLKIKNCIKLNNRKILYGIAEVIGEKDKIIDITIALDKIEKIGREGVEKEMREKGIAAIAITKLSPIFNMKGNNTEKLNSLKKMLTTSKIGLKGIEEVEFIFKTIDSLNIEGINLALDITLARGLNYYTGAIFEVTSPDFNSSICGGGRYDDLTSIFGLPNISGVGVSFGADRIYDLMLDKDLFPKKIESSLDVLFLNFGDKEAAYCLPLVNKLRETGISAELYPDTAKMKKQMKYADSRKAKQVVIVGSNEMESGLLTIKNMETGKQIKNKFENWIEG